MNEKEKDFVAGVFYQTFNWLDCRDIQCLYEKMKDGIYTDIIECADKDFNSDDVRCAIRRVLFNEFKFKTKNLQIMKETFNKQEIDIIVTALMHEMERYNKASDLVSDKKASKSIAEAKHRVYEVFKKANAFTKD